ncbi:rod shape-determining protein [Anaeromicropila herbilytica]|uniref:Cell shape-determining protein MreB n=1 Tax=Anaeromicropila herbilytica TaxID=2785025 RepID=A0A7R7ELQ3_9FIRM|nr:rod shape-determining protein [Anaeromicropila herbilytica]BCN31211.1 rod shape-determining protein [Anaeromicropila herbilytica]
MASKVFGIDFGTSTIKIYKKGAGIILDEKNVIAVENRKNVKAVGNEAYEMLEKAPISIAVTYPVRNGVIADIANMQSSLNYMLKNIMKTAKGFGGSEFVIAVPNDITEVEKKAFIDLIANSSAKAKNISVVDKPIADALGAGLDVTVARGVMVVDIGADTTEISIMSLGGIVLSKLIPIGGNKLDESIKMFVKKQYNLIIGDKTAETIKKQLASAYENEDDNIKVYGRNVVTGLPIEMEINSSMVYDSIKDYLHTIIESIRIILERTPPEISSDIIDSGIFITGGSANIKNLDRLISEQTDLVVNICSDPENTVVNGIGRIIEDPTFNSLAISLKQISNGNKMRE